MRTNSSRGTGAVPTAPIAPSIPASKPEPADVLETSASDSDSEVESEIKEKFQKVRSSEIPPSSEVFQQYQRSATLRSARNEVSPDPPVLSPGNLAQPTVSDDSEASVPDDSDSSSGPNED